VSSQTSYIKPLQDFTLIGDYKNMELVADKYHALSFRKKNSELINITIEGEIELPGVYTVNPSTSLAEVYELMGGFKNIAAQKNIIFLRNSTRKSQLDAIAQAKKNLKDFVATASQQTGQSIDPGLVTLIEQEISPDLLGRIGGNFTENSRMIDDFLLENGDRIIVPRKLNTVSIFGEVMNPNTVVYDKKLSLNDYIEMSGGLKQFALKNEIYIIKGNGTIVKRKRNIFLGLNKIEAGDVIIVPRDMRVAESLSDIVLTTTSTLYNLAFSAAAVDALRNN